MPETINYWAVEYIRKLVYKQYHTPQRTAEELSILRAMVHTIDTVRIKMQQWHEYISTIKDENVW